MNKKQDRILYKDRRSRALFTWQVYDKKKKKKGFFM